MEQNKKDPRDKPGQFTTEVHRTRVEARAEGALQERKSVGQLVKEAQEDLIEQGRKLEREDIKSKSTLYQQGFAEGQAVGIKVAGEALYYRGIEKGRSVGFEEGYRKARGVSCYDAIGMGVLIGFLTAVFGGLAGIYFQWFIF